MQRKLRGMKESLLFDDVTFSGRKFRRGGTATEKAQVPA